MAREQMLQRRAERRDRLAALGEALTALREQVHKTQEQYREAVIARHGVDDEVAALEQSITDLQAESAERVNRATALSEQIDASARAEAAEASGQVQRQGLLQQMRMSGSAGARRAAQREHRRLEEQIADDRRQLETLRQRLRNQRAESDALPLRIEALRAALNADQARIRDYQDLIGDLLSRDALEDEPGALTVKGVSSS
jgi:colicin import membrane protein